MDNIEHIVDEFEGYLDATLEKFDREKDGLTKDAKSFFGIVDECVDRAKGCAEIDGVISSWYFYLGSLLCFLYASENEGVATAWKKGKELLSEASRLIPDNKEYAILHAVYQIHDIDPCKSDEAFVRLKQIQKECPSFKLLENNLFRKELYEDIFNSCFEQKLSLVVDGLRAEDNSSLEEGCELLKSFPSKDSKLKAYSFLGSLYYTQNKLEEALRVAKLGIELLGNTLEYDYRNGQHQLWANCWFLVAQINREKKDYDFAMSLFEKGEKMQIVPCIRQLAEMYEKGEGDDVDPKEAERLNQLADSIESQREKERIEEEERGKREEEKRQKEIRRQEEELRIAEELKAREKEFRTRKILLVVGCVCCVAAIIWGIISLKTEKILDHVARYEAEGKAIVVVSNDKESPFAVFMDDQGLYVDDMRQVSLILPVGKSVETIELGLSVNESGVSLSENVSKDSLRITTSKNLYVKRLSSVAFLISTTKIGDPYSSSERIANAYHITRHDSETLRAIRIDDGYFDGEGYIILTRTGDVYPTYKKYFRSKFFQSQNSEIVKRKYGLFSVNVCVSLVNGTTTLDRTADFPNLKLRPQSFQVGMDSFRSEMENTIRNIFRAEFVESLYNNATKRTGINDRSLMRLSLDDKYVFVIARNYQEGRNSVALLRVDNASNTVAVMDTGMEVSFEENRIYVKRYSTFLLFFDSHTDVYYNYYGNQLR